jgi:hypothetical protein
LRGAKHKLLLSIALAGFMAGCGGSGSSDAERTKLVHKLSSQTSSLPPDLGQCVDTEARTLPISQLRDLANAGSNPSGATRGVALRILTTCVKAGHGVTAFRSVILGDVSRTFPKTVPARFKACVEDRVGTISPSQVSLVLTAFVTEGSAAAQATGERLGRSLARSCLNQPRVLAALRELFLAPIRRFARTSHFSAAFRYCVLRKAEHISLAQLKRFALNPVGATAAGVAIGRGFARACIASGARP